MLTIHVGVPKTGSSSLQDFLNFAPKSVRSKILYLQDAGLCGDSGFRMPRVSSDKLLRRITQDRRHVVISNENFLGPWGGDGLNLFADLPQLGLNLRNYFESDTEFQILCYLRPQWEWFESVYFQRTKMGQHIEPEYFVEKMLRSEYSKFSNLVSAIVEIFGPKRVIVRSVSSNRNVIGDFLGLFNLEGSFTKPRHKKNFSFGPAGLELQKRLADMGYSELGYWFLNRIGRRAGGQDFSSFPEDLQQKLMSVTQDDWSGLVHIVRETRYATPDAFKAVSAEASQKIVRPYIQSPAGKEAIAEEAARVLGLALPLAWGQEKKIWKRVSRKMAVNPSDLWPATVRFLRRRGLHGL